MNTQQIEEWRQSLKATRISEEWGEIDYLCDAALRAQASALVEKQEEAVVSSTRFCWLIELFGPDGNSMGYYHTGFSDLGYRSRATQDVHQARKYSKEDAEKEASKLLHLAGTWRATQHGFSASPPSLPQDVVEALNIAAERVKREPQDEGTALFKAQLATLLSKYGA